MTVRNKGYVDATVLSLLVWLGSAVLVWFAWGQTLIPPGSGSDQPEFMGGLFTLPTDGLAGLLAWPATIPQHLETLGSELLEAGYAWPLAWVLVPGAVLFAGLMTVQRGSWWTLGEVAVGCVSGLTVAFLIYWYLALPSDALRLLLPGGLLLVGGAGPQLRPPKASDTSVVRGTHIAVLPGDSSAAVKKALRQGATAFGGVVLDAHDEVSHVVVSGVTRVGKSLVLRELIYTALARGDRVIVVDPNGEAMKFFYKSGDVILNCYDARSVKWNLLAEIEESADYEHLAASLLPFSGARDARQWEQWAQDIFVACLRYWHENNVGTADEFTAMMAGASNEKLAMLCERIEAARVFRPGNEKMLGSILQTLTTVIKDLRLIASGSGQPFSVRQWLREGTGSLWIPYTAKQIPSLRRVASWWTSLAIAEGMSLEESETRRLWFIVDELDALGRITGLEEALKRGGKHGLCVAMGLQTIAQVRGTYGDDDVAAIVENCSNKLLLRCNQSMGGGTALFASEVIGDREISRVEMSNTQTEGKHGSSSTSVNVRRQVERTVLPSEIAQLPKREGYLKVESDPTWKRVRIAITKHQAVIPPYVPIKPAKRSADM